MIDARLADIDSALSDLHTVRATLEHTRARAAAPDNPEHTATVVGDQPPGAPSRVSRSLTRPLRHDHRRRRRGGHGGQGRLQPRTFSLL